MEDLSSVNKAFVYGEEFDNPFDAPMGEAPTMEHFLEPQTVSDTEGRQAVQYIQEYHNLISGSGIKGDVKPNILKLSGDFQYCFFIRSVNLFFVKFRHGQVGILKQDEVLSNRLLLSTILGALLDEQFGDVAEIDTPEGVLDILRKRYTSNALPMVLSGTTYDMIFSYNVALLCRNASDKKWVLGVRHSEFRGNKELVEYVSRKIDLGGGFHQVCVKNNLYDRLHELVSDIKRDVKDKGITTPLYMNQFGEEWIISFRNDLLVISSGDGNNGGYLSYIKLKEDGSIYLDDNLGDSTGIVLVVSCNHRYFLDSDINHYRSVEFLGKLVLEAYNNVMAKSLSMPLVNDGTVKYFLLPRVIFDHIKNQSLEGGYVDADSVNIVFCSLLGRLSVHHGNISSPLNCLMVNSYVQRSGNRLSGGILSGRVIALKDEDKEVLTHLGSLLGILIDRRMPLNVHLSKVMAAGLLAFTLHELENNYDDLSYRRRLQICQLLERSIGGNCLSDNLVEFVLGNNVDFGDDFDKVVRQFQYHVALYKKGVSRTKSENLVMLSCDIIDYINKEYLKHLESIFYLSKGMALSAKEISDESSDYNSPLMNWFSRLRGEYRKSIDDVLRSGDFSVMDDEIRDLGSISLYKRYATLRDSFVDGLFKDAEDFGVNLVLSPYDHNYHIVLNERISWLQEYISNAEEWEQREFLKFVSGGKTYDSWSHDMGEIRVYTCLGGVGEGIPFYVKGYSKGLNIIIPELGNGENKESFIRSLRKSMFLFSGSVDIL